MTNNNNNVVPLTNIIQRACEERMGFLSPGDVAGLAATSPRTMLLCRFGASRALVPASGVQERIRFEESRGDYIRDVSIPADHPMWSLLNDGEVTE